MNDLVLDASALLAYFKNEPGAEAVQRTLGADTVIGAVNLAEVVSKLVEAGWSEDAIRDTFGATQAQPVAFLAEDAYVAGLLRERTRRRGLSLGDRACLALALRLGAPALTADRSWADLDVGVEVIVVR
ncbi:MAG: type II toxin-antitoxin system VapC family toxin [Dehalococcoidia bacterium]